MSPRYELGRKVEERHSYTGTFSKYGDKTIKGGKVSTICLVNIKDRNGRVVTDHLWFNLTDGFRRLGWLRRPVIIGFDARVKVYRRSNGTVDYKLSHPSRVRYIADESYEREIA